MSWRVISVSALFSRCSLRSISQNMPGSIRMATFLEITIALGTNRETPLREIPCRRWMSAWNALLPYMKSCIFNSWPRRSTCSTRSTSAITTPVTGRRIFVGLTPARPVAPDRPCPIVKVRQTRAMELPAPYSIPGRFSSLFV
jgi:hypothetical protein